MMAEDAPNTDGVLADTDAAIIGLIVEKPDYRFAVTRRFQRKFGDALSERAIYRVIHRLVEDGMLVELPPDEEELASRLRPRCHYRATAAGARAFRIWRDQTTSTDEVALANRLAAAQGRRESLLGVVDRFEEACAAELDAFAALDNSTSRIEQLLREYKRLKLEIGLVWAASARTLLRDQE